MLYTVSVTVTPAILSDSAMTDEHLYRQLAVEMVVKMPIGMLRKVIKLRRRDTRSHNDEPMLLYEAQVSL